MKKHVLFVAAIFATSLTFAQSGEITSNRGENWLSESGDIGLSFSATPFLDYFGNLFNGSFDNNAPSATFANSYFAIEAKQLKDSNTAYRAKVRIGFTSTSNDSIVVDVNDPAETVVDKVKVSDMNIVLGAGLEKRIGSTRVVGIYGGEAGIMFGSGKTKYEYGNAIEDTGAPSRLTENKQGSTFGIYAAVFGGVEWFFAPKMSLGAEYTWGLAFASEGKGKATFETQDEGVETETGGNSNFGIDNTVSGADIKMTFYFQ